MIQVAASDTTVDTGGEFRVGRLFMGGGGRQPRFHSHSWPLGGHLRPTEGGSGEFATSVTVGSRPAGVTDVG